MNRSLFKGLAFVALVLAAGTALANPDAAAAVMHALFSPEAAALLAFGPLVRKLQAEHASEVDAMAAITKQANDANRDLTEEEVANFNAHKAKAESLKTRIEREQQVELMQAGVDRTTAGAAASHLAPSNDGRTVALPAAAVLQVSENIEQDPNRGFRSFGDFARSIYGIHTARVNGGPVDRRLQPLLPSGVNAAAPTTYASEGIMADGGVLVPPGFSRTITQLSLEEQALLPMTDVMPVEGNSMSIPKDETTPWGSTGVRAFWQGEASAANATKPVLGRMDLRLKKLMALVAVSDELMADATALTAYLTPNMARSIRWKTDEAVLFGSAGGLPLGAYAGNAHITVAAEGGQTAGTVVVANLAKMISRLMPGSFGRAVWIVNNDVLPQLFTMTLGNYPIYMPLGNPNAGGVQANPYGMLFGRPIIVSQHAKSIGAVGDIMLADLRWYQSITKAEGVSLATSMHLYFDADAAAMRATFRVDGQPKLQAPVSPQNGSNTLSPFVQLAAR